MKTLKIFITFILSFPVFAQLENIKEFPRAYESQEILDLTPVWISNNEILVFYKNSTRDTIFSRRTTNSGQSWTNQKFEKAGGEINAFYYDMCLFRTTTGRLLFFNVLSYNGINCYYSDDNGISWIGETQIAGSFTIDISVIEVEPGKIILSYSAIIRWLTRLSTDNGETWIEDSYYKPPSRLGWRYSNPHFIKLSASGDSLMAIHSSSNSIIYSQLSTDRGNTWSDTTRIKDTRLGFDFFYNLLVVKTVRDKDENIWLIYDRSYNLGIDDYNQRDVSVLISTDNGNTWQERDPFTSFLGDDYLTGVTSDGENILVCFNSSRDQVFNQGYFGILGQSEDTFTPPVLLNSETVGVDYEKEEVSYRAKVIDDQGVSKVIAKLSQINSSIELFDDGMHNDSLANDNIYGNVIPLIIEGKAASEYAMDLNGITLPFNNKGVIADVNIEGKALPIVLQMTDIFNNISLKEVIVDIPIQGGGGSIGKFEEGWFLFSGGFFLSGYSNGQMWSNAVASASLVEDYLPGKIGSDINDPLNSIYVVNKRDPAFGYTWQIWKDAVSLGAEFYDGDGDGIYNPVDKNWNGTWDINEDMPLLIGDEIAWCVYNDGLPKNQRRWNTVDPQGIEVRQTIFATDNPELENVIFIRYSILSTGTVAEVMDSVYFGIWEDGDMGDATNDVVGCDTLLNSAFYYENEPDARYGDNPPAFFTSLLQGPLIATNIPTDTAKNNFGQQLGVDIYSGSKNLGIVSHVFFTGGVATLQDPNSATEARNYLKGGDKLGQLPNPCNFAFGQVRGGVDCHQVNPRLWFSGDPVENIGWICDQNRDSRNLVSTGPFNLEKDKSQEIIIAYVIGRGNDPLNSVTVARENVQRAIQEYQSNFASMTYTPPAPTNPVNSYVLYQNYPNPFNPTTTIRYELPQDGQVTIEIFDILGQKVKTILNEFKKADRYEVTFSSTGLASGVYIYQLRINDFITSKKMVFIK
ncbi:MAG: exo-alpha-sialidase [Ignavibacteriaceae bacterium]|nr:exo-alpha-sialidase [Ignavibacteriaceae bacterium]